MFLILQFWWSRFQYTQGSNNHTDCRNIIGHLIVPSGEDSSTKINKIPSENIIYLSIGEMLFAEFP